MWVRGLKPIVRSWRSISTVAPYVGAWIETRLHPASTIPYHVAPYVGAWIETRGDNNGVVKVVESHPMWVRGLKLVTHHCILLKISVAPYVGAWIETKGL